METVGGASCEHGVFQFLVHLQFVDRVTGFVDYGKERAAKVLSLVPRGDPDIISRRCAASKGCVEMSMRKRSLGISRISVSFLLIFVIDSVS